MCKARALVASSLAFAAAVAAADRSPVIEEVVVTAQKRAQNVQDVPISIAVFNADTLDRAGVDDIRDLRRITPNLYIATAPQITNTRVAIRGIGTSGNTAIEPSVAFFVDGVYAPRVGSMLVGLNDIEAVEVLRGPQGTLFGRNASAGAISMRHSARRRARTVIGAAPA
jgi:iron complex outermembrane receptor protein